MNDKYDETENLILRLQLRWWAFRNWLRHCPECGQRGYYPHSPRWENDAVAKMLGINTEGCPRCGKKVRQ